MIDGAAKIALALGAGLLMGRAVIEVLRNEDMHDCSDDVQAYHDDEVTLPQKEQNDMRDRRDANRDRLKNGLKEAGKPTPLEFRSQGSYAMRTMTCHPEKAYDIDDGAYFAKEDLKGPRGADMTALEARQMVRDAVDDGSFKKAPEVRKNCVRVYYDAGYHVDIPVYRRVVTKDFLGQETVHYELASTDWKRSDAREVTKWFEAENTKQSPDTTNGRQLRRMTRDIKKFAKSRSSWENQILSGFGITKLVTECYRKDAAREDQALYDTMKAIRDRLNWNLVVQHPCTQGDTITNGTDDPKARFLRDKLSDALTWLEPLFEANCRREKALTCWDKVFNTTYFSGRLETDKKATAAAIGAPAILTSGLLKDAAAAPAAQTAVRKEGGGRYA